LFPDLVLLVLGVGTGLVELEELEERVLRESDVSILDVEESELVLGGSVLELEGNALESELVLKKDVLELEVSAGAVEVWSEVTADVGSEPECEKEYEMLTPCGDKKLVKHGRAKG
jgi:hypothetical protein